MKKILLSLACVFGMSTAAFALTSSAVLLQHNGNITTYAAEDIAQAMADADDGDEVFLNEGKYPGFTISKAIKIKGAGQLTVITGDITIDNSEDTSIGDIFIGFMNVQGTLKGISSIHKLDLLQCKLSGYYQDSGVVQEVFVDRCDICSSGVSLGSYYQETITIDHKTTSIQHPRVKKFTAMNSNIAINQKSAFTPYPSYTIINCYVSLNYASNGLTVINSIIHNYNYNLEDSDITNSMYRYGFPESCKATGCYQDTPSKSWTKEQLEEAGYYGNDGTVVGPLGGARNTPFTLVPIIPRVTESTLKVDPQKQELNVTVTVTPK